jgi:hypothetical protein
MENAIEEKKQLMLRGNVGFLSTEATLEQIWQHFYEMGCLFAKYENLSSSLGCFIDTFLIRGNEIQCKDRDWIDFFRHQFTVYLLGKKRISCSLSEGDMIHDFLKDEYNQIRLDMEESEFPFCCEDLHDWFASFELDFPWSLEELGQEWSIG